jgi:hypothetical protein
VIFSRPQVNERPGVGSATHCVCDGSDVNPGGHGMHAALPALEMNPSGHGWQDALPNPAKVPAGQTVQATAPGPENDPAGQARHEACPGLGPKNPGAHGVHGALPPGPLEPGGQVWAAAGVPRTKSSRAAGRNTIERMSNLVDQGRWNANPAGRTGEGGDKCNRRGPFVEWPGRTR